MKVVIAGGTGFLGSMLARRLRATGPDGSSGGHEVVVLSRSGEGDARWDGRSQGPWSAHLQGDEPLAVVNLAGRLVDARPTRANIDDLRRSRVDATRALVEAARGRSRPVERWLQASTTAIWSDAGERHVTESSPLPHPGLPQMTGVARAWEEAFDPGVADHHTILRTSIVLERGCPAWDRLALLARAGLGGTVGTGRQWFSWISLDDWLRVADAALGLDEDVVLPDGVVVAAAPNPVRNAELMRLLREAFHRPGLPTPALLTRVGAVALRTDPALALTGRHATSEVLERAGFTFADPVLAPLVHRLAR